MELRCMPKILWMTFTKRRTFDVSPVGDVDNGFEHIPIYYDPMLVDNVWRDEKRPSRLCLRQLMVT
jgi:hypothetical protein